MKITKYLLAGAVLMGAAAASAQERDSNTHYRSATGQRLDNFMNRFSIDGLFVTRFDNREYQSELSPSQTLFSIKARTTAAFLVSRKGASYHQICATFDIVRNLGNRGNFGALGTPNRQPNPEWALYYFHNSHRLRAAAGIFPREMMVSPPPTEIFSHTRAFYDPMIEGMLLRYIGTRWSVEFVGDWYSQYGATQREKFILYSSASWKPYARWRRFYVGYHASLQHFSESEQDEGVVDNAVLKPGVAVGGVKLGKEWTLNANVSWLQTFQRDRLFSQDVLTPGGVWIGADVSWRTLMLGAQAYFGDNIMPMWDKYGMDLYLGDPWYRTSHGVYNRIEARWTPRIGRFVRLQLSSIHHFDGKKWGWQQMATLSLTLKGSDGGSVF